MPHDTIRDKVKDLATRDNSVDAGIIRGLELYETKENYFYLRYNYDVKNVAGNWISIIEGQFFDDQGHEIDKDAFLGRPAAQTQNVLDGPINPN